MPAAPSDAALPQAIAPIVAVRDVATSVAFYRERLGFERMSGEDPGFAIVALGPARVMLVGPGDAAALAATAAHVAAYVWVEDLDALWARLAPRLADLPEGRVRPPFRQAYGMREVHVKDPDGFLLFFGEPDE